MHRSEMGSGAVLQNPEPSKDDSLYLTSYTIPRALVQDIGFRTLSMDDYDLTSIFITHGGGNFCVVNKHVQTC
jgi:hypothetical protein